MGAEQGSTSPPSRPPHRLGAWRSAGRRLLWRAFAARFCPMTVFVSMLRGVNVGGASRIKMQALQALYESLGLRDVRTLLQSGNVVFRSSLKDRDQLARRIRQEIERRLELEIEVLLRTKQEIESIVERGPVLSPRADMSKLLVMFLGGVPSAQLQARLLKEHKGPEML